jgi:hypothetical protein
MQGGESMGNHIIWPVLASCLMETSRLPSPRLFQRQLKAMVIDADTRKFSICGTHIRAVANIQNRRQASQVLPVQCRNYFSLV